MEKLKPTWKVSKKEILTNFSFLQSEFGFPNFKNKWVKDEYLITTRKKDIEFIATIYEFDSCAPQIGIINHSQPIEFNDQVLPTNFYQIHDLDKTGKLKLMSEKRREFIEIYISKCAELLKFNSNILSGITSDF